MGMERDFLGVLNFPDYFNWNKHWIFNNFFRKTLLKILKKGLKLSR